MTTTTTAQIVQCDQCDRREELFGEITERTLTDEGWYLGPTITECPDHNEDESE
jgi:hypothetical protein